MRARIGPEQQKNRIRGERRWVLALALLVVLPGAPVLATVDKRAPAPAREELEEEVKRPSWGKVSGWVLDAESRKPVNGARVAVELDGAFPEDGKATDETDAAGKYEARAPLGKISSKFDWGRVLTMSPLSVLISPRSVTKKTKILDVAQVNVRVRAAGYKPFLGRVRAMSQDAGKFAIMLDDVWLAPERSALASFTPERLRYEIVEGLTVEPAIAGPGEKVKISLATQLPLERGYKYRAYLTSNAIRVVENQQELKREKDEKSPEGNRVVFSRTVTLPKNSIDRSAELGFFLVRDDTTVLRQRETTALLQVVKSAEERTAAEKVAEGYAQARLGDRDAALKTYRAAQSLRADYSLVYLLSGDLAMQLNRPREAAESFKHLVDMDPRDYITARSRYARALFEAGQTQEAFTEVAEAEKALGKQRVPAEVALLRARVYASQSNFAEVDKWLAKAGDDRRISTDVLTEINLKRMAAAVKEKPNDADIRLSYARILDGAQYRERAIDETRKAAELDPGQPWAFIDLGVRLQEVGRSDEGIANLKHALALAPDNLEAHLALADVYRDQGRYAEALPLYRKVRDTQPQNLRARHDTALMLYATGALADARAEFLEVIAQSRSKGDLIDRGLPIPGPGLLGSGLYFGPKERLVAGFSIPEATADLAILEALEDLDKHPQSGLLWQNIGGALLDLDLSRLALEALRKSWALEPDQIETRFLLGVAYRKLGDAGAARKELEAAITANPLHPQARLELAQLYTDEGELERAQAEVAAHARNYPFQRNAAATRSFGG